MASLSAIEWTDATWNPVTGCTKVSPGCRYCYAERLTKRFGQQRFTDIVLHPERLDLPLRWRTPRMIFVNSMSDLFHDRVPISFIDQVFGVIRRSPHHVFQVLTKRPERLLSWHRGVDGTINPIPENAWLGVSVESMEFAWRVDRLRQVDGPVRFVSAEPLLGPLASLDLTGVAWLITGGESGGSSSRTLVEMTPIGLKVKPEAVRWVRELRDRCIANGIAFFHKQWGGPRPTSGGRSLDGQTWSEYPGWHSPDRQRRQNVSAP